MHYHCFCLIKYNKKFKILPGNPPPKKKNMASTTKQADLNIFIVVFKNEPLKKRKYSKQTYWKRKIKTMKGKQQSRWKQPNTQTCTQNQPTYCRVVSNLIKVNLYTFSVAYTLQTNTIPYIYIYNFI